MRAHFQNLDRLAYHGQTQMSLLPRGLVAPSWVTEALTSVLKPRVMETMGASSNDIICGTRRGAIVKRNQGQETLARGVLSLHQLRSHFWVAGPVITHSEPTFCGPKEDAPSHGTLLQ